MITFDLHCSRLHRFEGWFGSSADYQQQCENGLLACPICGDDDISKAPCAPFVGRKGNQAAVRSPDKLIEVQSDASAPVTNDPQIPDAISEMVSKLAEVQKEVLKDSTWVGREFAEEARAIHYGESDQRKIHGETSSDEAQALSDEGVSVAPLPLPFIPPLAKN